MKYIILVLTVVSLGCAGWGGYGSPRYGGTMGYGQSPSYLPPAAYGPSMGAMGYGGGYGGYGYVPPPPQDLAFVNGSGFPNAWRDTAHDVRIINNTDFYVKVLLDDGLMAVTVQYVPLPPFIPPGQEAHFYAPLRETNLETGCEHHYLGFESYLAPNFDQPVQKTGEDYVFCAGWDHQTVRLGGF